MIEIEDPPSSGSMTMFSIPNLIRVSALMCVTTALAGCAQLSTKHSSVPLSDIYDELAQRPDYERNPVIVIPGILGSQLTDRSTNEIVWGELYEFGDNHVEQLALPMHAGVPLHRLHDPVAVSYTHLTLPTICSV